MSDRKQFVEKLSRLSLSRVDQAIAFLWFYRVTQAYDERTASELAGDLEAEHLGRPNVSRLHEDLLKNKTTIKGKRGKTFQIHAKYVNDLNSKYGSLINLKEVEVTSSVLPLKPVQGTRPYLEKMVYQINGAYDYGFYDSCAVILRRLMETLIIEVFIQKQIAHEIKIDGAFLGLEKLISKIQNHSQIHLGRNTPKAMNYIKTLGDTAAHDRTYITQPQDIDEHKLEIRRVIQDLLNQADIYSKD